MKEREGGIERGREKDKGRHVCVREREARHLGGSALLQFHRLKVPEQLLDGISLGFGITVGV